MVEDTIKVAEKTESLRLKLEKHLGVKASSFERAVRRAGRLLPRRLRKKAAVLIEAQQMAAHPKLAYRIDGAEVEAAVREISMHLDEQDLSEQRKTRFLNRLALVAFNVLLVGALAIVFLRWRGLI